MLSIDENAEYDVCIIGSGAGGGMAAYALTQAGAKVVMLEAGGEWYASKNSQMLMPAFASPRRGASTRIRPFGEFDACDGGWDIEGEPYTSAPGSTFRWWRGRMLGGRTNHWGRISLRFGPDDFKGIDIMRAVRSFDPCLPCGVHMFLGKGKTLERRHSPMQWGE